MDWIRYTEMYDRINGKKGLIDTNNEYSISEILLKVKDHANNYPYNLFIKWGALLEYRAGNRKEASNLLKLLEEPSREKSIFFSMIPVIARMMQNAINEKYIYDNKSVKTITALSDNYPGFKRFAEAKGLLNRKDMNVEEIARLLPYYYS